MKLPYLAALCALLAAAGCGQKGPLYLPGDPNEGRIVLPREELPDGNGDDQAEPGEDEPTGRPTEEPAGHPSENDERSGDR